MEKISSQSNNLDTFSTLFLVKGILTALMAFIPLIYVFLGPLITRAIEQDSQQEIPFDIGGLFVVIGIAGFLFIAALALVSFMASSYLKKRKGYTFIFVIAILNCLTGVLGILLGVFTLVELNKPHVKALFEKS